MGRYDHYAQAAQKCKGCVESSQQPWEGELVKISKRICANQGGTSYLPEDSLVV